MTGALPKRDGYLVLVLALAMSALAALNLVARRETEETLPGRPAGDGGVTYTGETERIIYQPRPLLYFFLREAGFPVAVTARPPEERDGLMIVVNPPARIDQAFARDLFKWVEGGGRLILLCPTNHTLARLAGAEISPDPDPPGEWTLTTPAYRDVGPLHPSSGRIGRRSGAALVYTAEAGDAGFPAAFAGRGDGVIHILAAPDFFTRDGLPKAGNALLVVRLVERLSTRPGFSTVHFYHPKPDLAVHAKVKRPVAGGPAPKPEKRRKPDPSLLSLLLANPASLMFLQVALGLALVGHAVARRPARPVPAPADPGRPDTFAGAMARLLARRGSPDWLSARLRREFIARVRARLGLPAGDEGALRARLAADPRGEGGAALKLLDALHAASSSEERLLALAPKLDAFGKDPRP